MIPLDFFFKFTKIRLNCKVLVVLVRHGTKLTTVYIVYVQFNSKVFSMYI
jgi:hypothetical protein